MTVAAETEQDQTDCTEGSLNNILFIGKWSRLCGQGGFIRELLGDCSDHWAARIYFILFDADWTLCFCSHSVLDSPNMHVIPLERLRLGEGTIKTSELRSGVMCATSPGRVYLLRHVGDLLHLGAPLQYALILVNERGVWRGKPLQRSLILSKWKPILKLMWVPPGDEDF